jgi:hypothetical protein
MQRIFKLAALVLAAAALSTQASVIIFKGTESDAYIGESHNQQVTSRMYLLVDTDAGIAETILYATVNSHKICFTSSITGLETIEVAGAGKTVMALCWTSDSTSKSVFVQGKPGALAISPTDSIWFPKSLTYSGRRLYYGSNSGQPVLQERKFSVSFDKPQTIACNAGGRDLNTAADALISSLESLGYAKSQATVKNTAKSSSEFLGAFAELASGSAE